MKRNRWWHAAVLLTGAVLIALLFLDDIPTASRIGGLVAVTVLVVGWFALIGRAEESNTAALALTIVVVLASGVGVAFSPSFAVVQSLVFPILWTLWSSLRAALVANVALALAVGSGFLIALGTGQDALTSTIFTVALSLGFSVALGLWFTRVYHLVAEREVLIDELQAAQARVAALSRDAGAIAERERLARELHDTIAQDLTGLVLTAQRGRRELRSGNVSAAVEQLTILEDNARSALAETRTLVASGAPVVVEGGLTTALGRLGEKFERETGISVTVRAAGTSALDRDSEVVLLRCTQEALANVRKHSGATAASVTVTTTFDAVVLRVADNGVGFDTAAPRDGFGLDGMRDRLALADGSLTILSTPGHGVALVASLPATVPEAHLPTPSGVSTTRTSGRIHPIVA